MPVEIERKFIVNELPELTSATGILIRQGYLRADKTASVRVRITDQSACLTIKGAQRENTRDEFEYPIPRTDAEQLLKLAQGYLISKCRYPLNVAGKAWIIDVFQAENSGLVVAEVELDRSDEQVTLPDWIGAEVSNITRYLNANLCHHPYVEWSEQEKKAKDG